MGEELRVVELLVGEGVVSLEVEGECDVVGRGSGGDLSPEEELVGVGEFGEAEEGEFELESA